MPGALPVKVEWGCAGMESIKRNVVYNTVYQIFALVTPLITAPYISRVLGADGVGIFSFTSSVMAYFLLFAALGTASYGAREIARHRDDPGQVSQLFWEIEFLTVLTSLVCLGAWGCVIAFGGSYRSLFAALTPSLLAVMFDISWFFIGKELIKHMVIRNVLVKFAGIAALFLFVKEKSDLSLYVFLNSAITMLGNLSMWPCLRGQVRWPGWRSLRIRQHFLQTLVYFIPAAATSVYTVLGKTLIGVITRDTYENGYYEQATKLINLVKTLVFTSVNMVLGARISYLFSKGREQEIRQRIEKSLSYILLMGFGCTFGLIGIAGRFVPWFFGDGFAPVAGLLRLLAPAVLIIGVSNCLGAQYYTPSGQRAFSARILVTGAGVNLVLNLLLIPLWGAEGAVAATLLSESLITVLYVRFSRGYLTAGMLWRNSWKRLGAGLILLIAVLALGRLPWADPVVLLLQILCGGCLYALVLCLLRDRLVLDMIKSWK